MKHGVFSIDLVLIMITVLSIFPYIFFKVRNKVPYPVKSTLKLEDYYILSILLTYIVMGGYQQYFWTKDNMLTDAITVPLTYLDTLIEKNDWWVYIYNFIYYIIFGFVLVSIKDYKHFVLLTSGAFLLMSGLTLIWYCIPNITPERMKTNKYILSKTQKIDNNKNNACPSAHVVFSVYSYYLLRHVIGEFYAIMIPIIISLSCLKTSQHVFLDVLLGIIYTYLVYNFVLKKVNPKIFT